MNTTELQATTARTMEPGVALSAGDVDRFLASLAAKGRMADTLKRYRRSLELLASVLPEDGYIRRGTLSQCREVLLDRGYSSRSVNVICTAANSYLAFMDRREYQICGNLRAEEKHRPELTRTEYRYLLQTAKLLGREKAYLLVKLFACADMPVSELEKLTVEAAKVGSVTVGAGKNASIVRLPRCLCRELLTYCDRKGQYTGPVFLTRDGTPMNRTSINSTIKELSAVAKVSPGRATPMSLRRLYLERRKAMEANISLLVDQALERQLEEEQLTLGWDT